jgi:hypothetical protein
LSDSIDGGGVLPNEFTRFELRLLGINFFREHDGLAQYFISGTIFAGVQFGDIVIFFLLLLVADIMNESLEEGDLLFVC